MPAIRPVLARLHRWAGLAIAGFLAVAGLTGAVIAFESELEAALNPSVFKVRGKGPPLSPSALAAAVEAAEPRLRVTRIEPPEEAGRAAMMVVRPRTDPATGKPFALGYNQIFVDSADGAVTGVREWGACCLEPLHLVPFLYRLHFTLALPNPWGRWLMGGIAVLWFLDTVNGLILTLPRRRPLLAAWAPAWTIRRDARGPRLHFDLHRACGLWFWLLLLILAFSSIAMNLRREVFNPVVGLFSPLSETALEGRPPRPQPVLSFDEAVARARADAEARGEGPELRRVSHHPDRGTFVVRLGSGGAARTYVLDGGDGRILLTARLGEGSAGDVFAQVQAPLHTGQIAGRPGRVVVAMVGLAGTLLAVTGVLIWWTRRQARRRRPQPFR